VAIFTIFNLAVSKEIVEGFPIAIILLPANF
jgi:hypothetical protein